jgi:uncharacterized membrane protein
MAEESKKATFGLEENLAGALCYAVGWVTGLIFLLSEKNNQFVRFHAMQSIITFGILNLATVVVWFLSPLVGIISFVLWLVCIFKAYQGEKFHLPVLGEIADKQVKKIKI